MSDGVEAAVDALVETLETLLNVARIAPSLHDLGVAPAAVPDLAAEAARQWTAQFNPCPLGVGDFVKLFEAAFEPRRPAIAHV
ncbi:MAG: hypothetical protein M5U12_13380 [Verrucomicrobia bacterium]|nr:hypothetical protein [Verrucomicrobiota bacterium]